MKNACGSCSVSNSLGLLLARVPAGIVLALAGISKFRAPGGVQGFVDSSLSYVPSYMPSWFGNLYLHAVPYAEVTLGALLVIGLFTRVSGLLAALMLTSFGLSMGGVHGFFESHPDAAPQLFKAPFTYGVLALVAMLSGPGGISLDGILFGGRRTRTVNVEKI